MPTTVAFDIPGVLVPDTETDIVGPVPVGQEYDLPVIRFVNNDVEPHSITVWNKNSAAAGTDAQLESPPVTIQPQSIFELGPLVLAAGRRISAQADAAGVINAVPHGWMTTF